MKKMAMAPILCNYYLTYRCNGKCRFCEIWRRPEWQGVPDARLTDVLYNLKVLRQVGIKFVDFTGGEPLLYPELPEALHFARARGFLTSITTNCQLYPERASEIKGLVNFLHFSLDALNPSLHNQLRGGDFFDAVMTSVELAHRLGERPDILFTVTPKNYQELPALAAFCQQQRFMLIVNPVFGYRGLADLPVAYLDFLDQYRHHPFVYINRAFHQFRRAGGNQRQQPRCRAVSTTIVISPENKILLPCFHHAVRQLPIQQDLNFLLRSADYQQFRAQEGQFEFCQHCTINCYLEPSFTQKIDRYWWLNLRSKIKYIQDKYGRLANPPQPGGKFETNSD